jgi:methionyl-tRNA formyltransferase
VWYKYLAVSIKPIAQDFGLPLHQLDGFDDSDLSGVYDSDFNLIIAVSFGLLIPADLISRAKYGGLNVHPSFLPEYGSIHWYPNSLT